MDNRWEKIDFADLVKDAKSVEVFLLPANFESDGMTSNKHGLAAKTISKWLPPKSHFFRIAGTSEAETSVSTKAECLLAIGLLFYATPSVLSRM